MKKIISIVILCLVVCTAYSQAESSEYKTISDEFQLNYNNSDTNAIFSMFADNMKKAVPLDKLVGFIKSVRTQSGDITNKEFLKYDNGNVALYKTSFEHDTKLLIISIDVDSKINGLLIKAFKEDEAPKIERNKTKLKLPFNGEWTVFWGGDTKEQNYHIIAKAQKKALDIAITDENGKTYKTDGKTNEDYYVFGKELIAPCDGEIILVVDGIKDNIPGELNPIYAPGNTVIIKTRNNEYLFLAHFKQNSILVKQGQFIKQGELLGLSGNSGNSIEPHLHFHIQDIENTNRAAGVKCFFESILVNGKLKRDYSPLKNEKIMNEK